MKVTAKALWELLPYYAKAVVGFVAPGASILVYAVTDGSAGGSRITTGEWVTAACACVITAAGVAKVPNK